MPNKRNGNVTEQFLFRSRRNVPGRSRFRQRSALCIFKDPQSTMYKKSILFFLLFCLLITFHAQGQRVPLRVGVVGLTHTHVHWILGRPKDDFITLVGIVETNKELALRYTQQHGLSMDLVFSSMEEMIAKVKPEAVTAFGTIYEHLTIVEKCAPLGIHVMVEKPLAVSLEHAGKMQALAKKYKIHLLTNYETTWYPTVHAARDLLKRDSIGSISQLVIRDGHRGPLKIGVNKEFLEWLIDPVKNGGGAITDLGCYGANAKTTIQASWNWPIGRKDMELYGTTGVVYADNRNDLRMRKAVGYDGYQETKRTLAERPAPYNDPFSFLAAVVRKEISPPPSDLSSLENNMVVMEILDAAKKSARMGQTVLIK